MSIGRQARCDVYETAVSVISGLLSRLHVEAAEQLFETIILLPERCSAARGLYLYFTQTDAVPEKAALCLAISKTCDGG